MYNIFVEICKVVKRNVLRSTETEAPSSSPNAHSWKREQCFSPTGLNPHAKTTTRPMASNKNVRTRLNLASAASTGHDQLNISSEQESAIANLMNLPVAEDETKSVPMRNLLRYIRQMLFVQSLIFLKIIKIYLLLLCRYSLVIRPE